MAFFIVPNRDTSDLPVYYSWARYLVRNPADTQTVSGHESLRDAAQCARALTAQALGSESRFAEFVPGWRFGKGVSGETVFVNADNGEEFKREAMIAVRKSERAAIDVAPPFFPPRLAELKST